MDNKLSSPRARPIILSPPPLEQHKIQPPTNPAPPGLHAGRQQSVGYNMQHEFETLSADFDLDFKHNLSRVNEGQVPVLQNSSSSPKEKTPTSTTASVGGINGSIGVGSPNTDSPSTQGKTNLGNSLLAPSASKYGFMDLNSTMSPMASSMLHEQSISPIPVSGSIPAGLGQMLQNHSSNSGGSTSNLHPDNYSQPSLLNAPNRPQSAHDFLNFFGRPSQDEKPSNFYLDLLRYTNWIENLSPQDTVATIDYMCNNLPLDILLTFRTKLDNHLNHQNNQFGSQPQNFLKVMSPYQQYQGNDLMGDMEQLSLDPSASQPYSGGLYQPKPKQNFRSHLFGDKTQRSKSADPGLHNKFSPGERAKSPTSHLYEKTNFLQLAAANNSAPSQPYNQQMQMGQNQQVNVPTQTLQSTSEDSSLDYTALKLGALATINSRVVLDSNRKNNFHLPQPVAQHNHRLAYEESLNRAVNSSSVPISSLKYANQVSPSHSQKSKKVDTPSSQAASNTSMPAEVSHPELLENIPAWLKLLRLHKYTDCLKDLHWKTLVELNDEQLEEKGVKALGARRKLLKAFDAVKATNLQ